MVPPPVAHTPATSLSLPRQIAVDPGGLPLQLSPWEEFADAITSPLIRSGEAALPLPIRTVIPATLPGQPTDPGHAAPALPTWLIVTRFLKVTSPVELSTAKP